MRPKPGSENLADMGAKDVSEATMKKMMNLMGFREMSGRHPRALTAGTVPCAGGTAGDDGALEGLD